VNLRRSVIALVVTTQSLVACTLTVSKSSSSRLDVAGHSTQRIPGTGATQVGVYQDQAGTCFGYTGSESGGGHCMRAVGKGGWAVEVSLITAGDAPVLLVAGDARTAVVRVPRPGLTPLVIQLTRYPGISAPVAAIPVDPTAISLTGNVVAGYDARDRLLGHTHACEGGGGPTDCGPFTGLIDQTMTRPQG